MSKNKAKTSILITSDFDEKSYQLLIDQACKIYAFFSVIVRSDLKANPSTSIILNAMKANQHKIINTKRLPMGEIRSAHPAQIFYFTTTPREIRSTLKKVGSLFGWVMPQYPEDLCFYRADKSLAIASNSHESRAFFFDKEFIDPFLEQLEWYEKDYTENFFTNLLAN